MLQRFVDQAAVEAEIAHVQSLFGGGLIGFEPRQDFSIFRCFDIGHITSGELRAIHKWIALRANEQEDSSILRIAACHVAPCVTRKTEGRDAEALRV
jgi:hypothetical protein